MLQDCIFLEDKLCSIYKVRPVQCATYPWWPELMDPAAWQQEGKEVCEGFDHEDADPLNMQDATAKLKLTTEHFVVRSALPDSKAV